MQRGAPTAKRDRIDRRFVANCMALAFIQFRKVMKGTYSARNLLSLLWRYLSRAVQ